MQTALASFRMRVWPAGNFHIVLLSVVVTLLFARSLTGQEPPFPKALESLPTSYHDGFAFVPVQALADALDLRTYYSQKARKVILYLAGEEVKVTAWNPFVVAGDRVLQLPLEARTEDGEILVPMPYFLDALRSILPREMAQLLDPKPADTDTDGGADEAKSWNIQAYQVEQKANGTLIRIATTRSFKPSELSSRVSKNWLHVDVLGGRLNPALSDRKINKGLVREFRALQGETLAHLSFRLRKSVTERKVFYNPPTREIWVSLPAEHIDRERIEKALQAERQRWRLDTVVIDPGHGGRDPGAIGPRGVREKDVVLAIARHLRKLLEKRSDVRVVMTRESDVFVPLNERTAIANREQGKLFISLHANSNRSPRVTGATTYFLGPAKTEEALEVAARENSAIHYEGSTAAYEELTNEKFILLAMAQNSFNHESQDLAALVQQELSDRTGLRDRGVKQAGYYVLVGASMPNILVELAFISNRQEERLLASRSFQRKAAEALCESILRFKAKYDWDQDARLLNSQKK